MLWLANLIYPEKNKRTLSNELQREIDETLLIIGQSNSLEDSKSSLWKKAVEIDKALNESNPITLPEHLSVFGDWVDQLLFRADKKLLEVVGEINHLPRPSFVQWGRNARLQ